MMKKFARSAALLCVLVLAVSCNSQTPTQNEDNTDIKQQTSESVKETEAVIDETGGRGEIASALPDNLDFGGASLTLLSRTEPTYLTEFLVEENGEVVNDAVFKRNLQMQETLNVDFHVIARDGAWGQHEAFMRSVQNDVASDAKDYDVISFYAYANPTMAAQGIMMNLYDIRYIDFEKPWYHQMYIDNATVYGKLYALSGDITLSTISHLNALFFNKSLFADYYPDVNLYKDVLDGKWTVTYMLNLVKDIYSDLDGDGKESDSDLYGFHLNGNGTDSWAVGQGIRYCMRTEDGGYVYDLYNERNEKIINDFYDAVHNNKGVYDSSTASEDLFQQDHTMFIYSLLSFADTMRYKEADFGILPLCKMDESQEHYYSAMNDNFSQILVPITCRDTDMVGAFIECMSELSYKTVTPAWYETAMKGKYLRDNESCQMFDIIVANAWYDFATINTSALGDPVFLTRNAMQRISGNFASQWAK